MRPGFSRNTWRQYKAAVIFTIEEAGFRTDADELRKETSIGTKPKGEKTSATKRKGFPSRDRIRVFEVLIDWNDTHTETLIRWIRATICTGLRPCEWKAAEFVERHPENDGPALLVRNAKNTHGRANGDARTLLFNDDFSPQDLDDIRIHAALCADLARNGLFDRVYDNCRHLMRHASRAAFRRRKQHYTLYSCRHQFSANAKKVTIQGGVAALMGHASAETATIHYGRAAQGEGGSLGPVPHARPAEIATVKPAQSRADKITRKSRKSHDQTAPGRG